MLNISQHYLPQRSWSVNFFIIKSLQLQNVEQNFWNTKNDFTFEINENGFVNVPIIKFSVDWWASLHQPSSVKILSETTIHSSMLTPLLLMTAAFALFSILIFLMKYNIELIKIKTKGLDRLWLTYY